MARGRAWRAVTTVIPALLASARAVGIVRSERHARAELRATERFFTALAAGAADRVIVIDAEMRVTYRSDRPQRRSARAAGRGGDVHLLDLLAAVDDGLVRAALQRSLRAPRAVVEVEIEVDAAAEVGGRGEAADQHAPRWLGARFTNLLEDPDVAGIVVNLHDVSDRKQAQGALVRHAFHDALTGLPNRTLFGDRVEHALQRRARTGRGVVVMYIDLNSFKLVNDSLGHEAGDEVLRVVAQRLRSAMRSEDTVARLGGDEFAVLMEDAASPADEGPAAAERVLTALGLPFAIGATPIRISASVGVTVGHALSSSSSLLREADVAMYSAKSSGSRRWALYEHEMGIAAVERLQLTNDLDGALARSELRLVYQPVVELADERIVGLEALLRWEHPALGLLTPDRFIALAESTGHIVDIGRWVLSESCRTVARWQRELGRPDLGIAVNVSGHQLACPELPRHVATALQQSGLSPACLTLELTESVLVDDPITAAQRLDVLRCLGVLVAIDDFGTGFSSLSYLHQLPIDILKIDRSFVGSISEHRVLPAVVAAIIDLADSLHLDTIAEGIELSTQRDQLKDQRCTHGQGFLFARPLSPDEARELLHAAAPIHEAIELAAHPACVGERERCATFPA